MPTLNLDLDFFDHRKTKRLVFLLGEGAELYLIRLWVYCGKFHPEDGVFDDESASEIEAIAGWKGDAGSMLQAMLQACYMHCQEQKYSMHDWQDHQGHICRYSLRGKNMAKARWTKNAVSNAAGMQQAMPEQTEQTEQSRAEHTQAPPSVEVEIPSWDEFWKFCQVHANVPEPYANDKYLYQEQRCWKDCGNWKAFARRLPEFWRKDGYPHSNNRPPKKRGQIAI